MCKKYLFLASVYGMTAFAGYGQWKGKPADAPARLEVSDNSRFLQYGNGEPFFYLGDTAWELFHRADREEADIYLQNRARKGFTVIQTVALAELDGHTVPNAYGHLPFIDADPARPALKDGDYDYWDHVDHIVEKANELGMYVGFLPTWGRYWRDDGSVLFDPGNAYAYGRFLGERYKDRGIIWILGGDRSVDSDLQRETIEAMVRGLKEGDGGRHLVTFHPYGGGGSSQWYHQARWLDFNMRQNGHGTEYTGAYANTYIDYLKDPAKPVIDGEPVYEDHPVSFKPSHLGHSLAADVRRALYWDLFDGAFGHVYGHHAVWQMWDPVKEREPVNNPLMSWQTAIGRPGAAQMQYGRMLMESRPFFTRIPDPKIIVKDRVATSVPGEGRYRFAATRDREGTYAMVYVPAGREFTVRTDVVEGDKITAWWYNPRNGKAAKIGTFENSGEPKKFISPEPGELTDWILVLDDAGCKFPAPGKPYRPKK